jgi:hypothetical protein
MPLYGCSLSKNTKGVYTYGSRGMQLLTETYEGTAVETADVIKLSDLDKFALHKIDSCIKTETIDSSGYNL